MRSSNHDPINWGDLTHDHITQYFWVPFATYMGKYSRNKTKVKFADVNSSALKKSAKSLKKLRQLLLSRIHPKSVQGQKGYFLETFGPSEINQGKGNSLKPMVSFQLSND